MGEPGGHGSAAGQPQRLDPATASALLCGLVLLALGLAIAGGLGNLRANHYIDQGLHHVAALAISQEIATAGARTLAFALAVGILALLSRAIERWCPASSWPGRANEAARRRVFSGLRSLHRRAPTRTLILGGGVTLGAAYGIAVQASHPPVPTGPSVLLIVMDTVRRENLSTYGHFRETTPNLDRFATSATVFEEAYAIAPWTIPNHASMFTGRHAAEHGATQESKLLPGSAVTLAELMSEYGYATAAFSNNANVAERRGLHQGFRDFLDLWRTRVRARFELAEAVPDGDEGAYATGRAVAEWMDSHAGDPRPWFVFVNYIEAHSPYEPPARLAAEYIPEPPPLPPRTIKYDYVDFLAGAYHLTEREFRISEALYDAEIRYLDEQLGALLDDLEKRDALQGTLVIITSDHGENFGEHDLVGHQFGIYDTVLRVPLVVRAPDGAGAGQRSTARVELTDLFTTILTASGAATPLGVELSGADLLAGEGRDAIYAEHYRPLRYLRKMESRHPGFDRSPLDRRIRSIREGPYKLIWSSDGRHELYRVDEDPDETLDLAERDADRVTQLGAKLEQWAEERARRSHPSPSTAEPELDEEMREALKALGYVE